MRMLSFSLIALVGTMILGLPLQSYAAPQLDILLSIATQARDNLGVTISQTNNTSAEINALYQQGSTETDELAKAVAQQDADSAKQHFLAAMKFFKETNDKINSLNAATTNNQQAEITQLRGEIIRLDSMESLLKSIATNNNIDVNFTNFDELIQTAQQDLDAGNVGDATTAIKNANAFLVQTHNSLTTIAQERISERAKDFTEKQIERFSKINEFNATSSTTIIPPTQPPTTIMPPTQPPTTPPTQPPTVSENTTGINATSSTTITPPTSVSSIPNNSNVGPEQNLQEMLTKLKKLVSEGKINEALKVIKLIEMYQKEQIATQKAEQPQSATGTNTAGNLTNSTTPTPITPSQTPPTPTAPPPQPPTLSENATGINTTNSTTTTPPIQPPTTPPAQHLSVPPTTSSNTTGINATSSSTTPSTLSSTTNDHEKYNLEKGKHNKEQQHHDVHPNFNSRHD